jgi:hypothetical protein
MRGTPCEGLFARVLTVFALVGVGFPTAQAECWAQTIRGHVVDSLTFERVPLVQVMLLDTAGVTAVSTTADSVGYFRLEAEPGHYRIRLQREGYKTTTFRFFELEAGASFVMELSIPRIVSGSHFERPFRWKAVPQPHLGMYRRGGGLLLGLPSDARRPLREMPGSGSIRRVRSLRIS